MTESNPISEGNYLDPSRERLLEVIAKTLRKGDSVEIGDSTYRFLKRGAEFEDGEFVFQALETGVFQRCLPQPQSDGTVGRPHWLRMGQLDDAEDYLTHSLDQMGPKGRDELMVTLCANAALRSINEEMQEKRARYVSSLAK